MNDLDRLDDQFYRSAVPGILDFWAQELGIYPGRHYVLEVPNNGPRILSLSVVVNPRYRGKLISMAEDLAMAAGLDENQAIRVSRGQRGRLVLEIPKPHPRTLRRHDLPRRRGAQAVLGVDMGNRPRLLDFRDPLAAHALVAGTTGSGKTNTLRLLVHDLAQNTPGDIRILLIDIRKHGVGWAPFERLPHLLNPVITEDDTALRALAWMTAQVDQRAQSGQRTPRVFAFIDEAQALLEQEQFVKPMADLVSVGREFGLHAILGLQNPTAAHLGNVTIKRNLTVRLCGKVDDGTAAHVATGQEKTGADKLGGAGDFLMVQNGIVSRLTMALVEDGDLGHLPRAEGVAALALEEFEDIDHVLSQAAAPGKVGRRPDPLDFQLLGHVLGELSTRGDELVVGTFANQLHIAKTKLQRHLDAAGEVLTGLNEAGFWICGEMAEWQNAETADRNG
jgi:hypothetical protein